jgi:hypothetical protein
MERGTHEPPIARREGPVTAMSKWLLAKRR